MSEQIKITIVCDASTGEIIQVQGPLEMKGFMVSTLAAAIQIVVSRPAEPSPHLVPTNGNTKATN